MKELLTGETYKKSYIAIPITGQLFETVQRLNGNKKFYHLTIFFMGRINDSDLTETKELLSSIPETNSNLQIIPEGLSFTGGVKEAFVLKVKKTDWLMHLRELFEKSQFNNKSRIDQFEPHITIEVARRGVFSRYDRTRYLQAAKINRNLEPCIAEMLGLYYRTEEGATALLLSKKL